MTSITATTVPHRPSVPAAHATVAVAGPATRPSAERRERWARVGLSVAVAGILAADVYAVLRWPDAEGARSRATRAAVAAAPATEAAGRTAAGTTVFSERAYETGLELAAGTRATFPAPAPAPVAAAAAATAVEAPADPGRVLSSTPVATPEAVRLPTPAAVPTAPAAPPSAGGEAGPTVPTPVPTPVPVPMPSTLVAQVPVAGPVVAPVVAEVEEVVVDVVEEVPAPSGTQSTTALPSTVTAPTASDLPL